MVSHVLLISVELLRVLLLLLFLFLLISLLFLFLVVLLAWFNKLLEFVKIIRDICVLHFYF